jgi:hypothetical protein
MGWFNSLIYQNSGFRGLSKIEYKSLKILDSEIYKGKIEKIEEHLSLEAAKLNLGQLKPSCDSY